MNRFFSRFTLLLAIALVAISMRGTLAPLAHSKQDAAKAEWTMLFYLDADNDLEAPQMQDLNEMLKVGSTKDVNIVVLADRHVESKGKYTNMPVANLKDWTTAKLLVVEKGKLREIADWGEVNMGDPAVLKKFVETGVKDFPAQRYGVVFGDHGMAWPGVCSDESHDHDFLTTQEIPAALKDAAATIGKFELIGFDACLMANFEVAKAMAPVARVMVASEELEPGDGWNYTPLFQAFTARPKMNGAELGKVITDTFSDFFNKSADAETRGTAAGITLSVLALDKLDALEKALNDLATGSTAAVQKGREGWLKIAQARAQAEEYGKSGDSKGEPGSAVHDVIHFAANVKQREAALAAAADAVVKATKDVVVYEIHGKGRPHATGLSIFIPPNGETLQQQGPLVYSNTAFARSSKWLPFLQAYTGVQAKDTTPPKVEPVANNDASVDADDVVKVTAKLQNADDIEEASFVVAMSEGDEQIIIGEMPTEPDDNGVLEEEFDGAWFSLGDGTKEVICPISNFEELDDAEDLYWAEVPVQVKLADTDEWLDVTLYFILDFSGDQVTGDLVYAFEDGDWGPREIELSDGDLVRAVYIKVDGNGDVEFVASDDDDSMLEIGDSNDLVVGEMDLDAGKYLIGFVVSDYAGNTDEEFTEVTIE